MQKYLVNLLAAVMLTVPAAALADTGTTTLYGVANLSYDFVDSGNATAVAGTRSQRVSSNTSLIGLRGYEELGADLKALWQVEQGIDMSGASNAASGFATRNTYAGLSSTNIGTLLLGRHDTPYQMATRRLDQFADGIADNRSLMGVSGLLPAMGITATAFDGRQPDVIAYISPVMAGLTVAVAHVNLNQALNQSQALSHDSKMRAWSLAGLYGNGPFFASLAYETHGIGAGTAYPPLIAAGFPIPALKENAYKLGLGYTHDMFNVGFAYEKTRDNFCGRLVFMGVAGSNCMGHYAWYLGGKYNFTSNDAVKLAYTRMGNPAVAQRSGWDKAANQWSLGYDHNMSKRTTVYALCTRLNNGINSAYGLSNNASSVAPITGIAAGAGNMIAGAGADSSAFSIGLKHMF